MQSPTFDKPIQRILANILIFILIGLGHWLLACLVILALLFIYVRYYEIILWGIIIDMLYYPAPISATFFGLIHLATIGSIVILFITIFFKKRLTFYS